jgi:DNA-binding transcriptional ArsR family regulator
VVVALPRGYKIPTYGGEVLLVVAADRLDTIMSPNAPITPRRTGDDPSANIDEEELLAVLTDERCRQILSALIDQQQTASELLDRLDIPCSTLYRKIERLVDGGLLAEQTRVRLDGNNETEYSCRVDRLSLDIVLEDGVQIDLSESGQDTGPDRTTAGAVYSD